MEHRTEVELHRIIEALDDSIVSAIASPQLAGGESLSQAEQLCRGLSMSFTSPGAPSVNAGGSDRKIALLWEIRSRLGRLMMLLEAAGDFYRSLSTAPGLGPPHPGGLSSRMDYNVQGEWKETSTSGLLSINC